MSLFIGKLSVANGLMIPRCPNIVSVPDPPPRKPLRTCAKRHRSAESIKRAIPALRAFRSQVWLELAHLGSNLLNGPGRAVPIWVVDVP